jgi:hypothetical protein
MLAPDIKLSIIKPMEKPSPEDLQKLEEEAVAYAALDKAKLKAAREAFQLAVPPPYDEMLSKDRLSPTIDSLDGVREAIADDEKLSPEERHALGQVAFDRWHSVVVAQAGEGFND